MTEKEKIQQLERENALLNEQIQLLKELKDQNVKYVPLWVYPNVYLPSMWCEPTYPYLPITTWSGKSTSDGTYIDVKSNVVGGTDNQKCIDHIY